ncbi:hypothetical protein [Oceanobacillus sojae]|nr:hypothetical protein [Oceanobacillus sojae]MCT1904345.1 hypothetical protein [Oceanobacillus sojae]
MLKRNLPRTVITKTQLFTGLKEPEALAKEIVPLLLYGMTRGKNEM